jgi:nicotinamidase-related amidase
MTAPAASIKNALLVMDVQRGIIERYGNAADSFLDRLVRVIDTARAARIPVIYVTVRFREGHPEVSPRNRSFSALAGNRSFVEGTPASEIHPRVAPREGDVVVTKRRVGAFTGSDLEVVLRSLGIETIVLSGIATSGVVLSTVRAAADMDYRIVVLSDCTVDADEEVHRVLTTKVFPRQAEVMTSTEWIERVRETT